MVKTFFKMIAGFFESFAQGLVNFVLEIFSSMGILGQVVLDLPVVTTGILFTQVVALSLLSVKVSYEAWMTYDLRQMGEPTSSPMDLLVGAARATAVISSMPWIVKYLYQFGLTLSSDIAAVEVVGAFNADDSSFKMLLDIMASAGDLLIFLAIGIIVALVMAILICIQNFIRAADLAVAAWTGAFAALSLTNTQSQAWNRWFMDTLGICLTGALQLALLKLAFNMLAPMDWTVYGVATTIPSVVRLFLFIAVLWVAYKSPTTLKEKMNVTGVGRIGGAAAQMASQSIVMRVATRRMK